MTKADELPKTSETSEANPDDLLRRFQAGDHSALEGLWSYYLPRLQRWARGRIPADGHDGVSADDLVQEAFVKSLPSLHTLQARGGGTLFGYLRMIVLNQMRDHARRRARRPRRDMMELDAHVHPGPSPLEEVLGREVRDFYEHALAGLPAGEKAIVVAVVEHRCSDTELAVRFAKPSRDAARMARRRAVARLVRAMPPPYRCGSERTPMLALG
jgi:RNA polymerase sigma factor (sigma-70 family)